MDPGTMMLLSQVAGPLIQNMFGGGGGEGGYNQVPTKTQGQQSQLNTALEQWQKLAGDGYEKSIGLLQSLLDPNSETYKNFEAPFMQQFEQQTLPGIAERFAGMNGMGGGLASSGFGQALGAAGAGLQTNLAQLREQLRMQGAQGILGQYNQGFGQTQQQEPFALGPKDPSMAQSMLAGGGQGIANAGMNFLMNQGVGNKDQGRGYKAPNMLQQLETMFRQTGGGF